MKSMERLPVTHILPPIYDENSRVLVLGTMPSPKSRENGFYYGHPQNRFWRVAAAVFKQPVPQTNEERRNFLLQNRIAMWDVLHSCAISGADDASIKNPVPNDISLVLTPAPIETVFTTGAKAYELYNKYCQPNTGVPAVPLPSTSAANCRSSFEALVQAYLPLAAGAAGFARFGDCAPHSIG